MTTFEYPLLAKLIYRYGNIPISLILIFYLVIGLTSISTSWVSMLMVFLYSVLLVVVNKFYFRAYKTFPYKIDIDNEKMICSNYFFSDKILEVKLADIESITGGVFSNSMTKPLYLKTSDDVVGFHYHLKNYNKLVTIILSNIKQELYNRLLQKIQDAAVSKRQIRKKKS
jgi:energy-coupling factor transporter transmembrane protein EcfT